MCVGSTLHSWFGCLTYHTALHTSSLAPPPLTLLHRSGWKRSLPKPELLSPRRMQSWRMCASSLTTTFMSQGSARRWRRGALSTLSCSQSEATTLVRLQRSTCGLQSLSSIAFSCLGHSTWQDSVPCAHVACSYVGCSCGAVWLLRHKVTKVEYVVSPKLVKAFKKHRKSLTKKYGADMAR